MPTLLGEITAVNATAQTVTVQLVSGESVEAAGTGTIGDKVYITGGIIDGPAPSLPSYSLLV